jgi:amidohydrolase
MRFGMLIVIVIGFASGDGIAADAAALHDALAQHAAALESKVVSWRRDLHQHPELGNREFRTSAKVAEHLRALGLEPVIFAHTGVVALLDGARPGPRLALRADMDALPVTEEGDLPFKSSATTEFRGETVGVMHACGHDAHTAILMGAAQALVAVRDQLPGSVLFVFQPAEEGPPEGEEGGAELMLKQGLFERYQPDAIVGLHVFSLPNVGQIGIRRGPIMAESDRFRIVVKGSQTHGAKPWAGVDPIVTAAQIVLNLQTIVSRRTEVTHSPAVVSVGAIKSGIRYNIIPDSAELIGTVRTFHTETRDRIYADIRRIAEHTALANGASAEVETWEHTGVNVSDPALTARLMPALEAVVGRENVIEIPLQTVAEDFSYFSDRVPGMYFFVGATPKGDDPHRAAPNHSPRFFLDEGALDVGLRATVRLTADFLAAAPVAR